MTGPCARPLRGSLLVAVWLGLAPATVTAAPAPTTPAPAPPPAPAPAPAPAPGSEPAGDPLLTAPPAETPGEPAATEPAPEPIAPAPAPEPEPIPLPPTRTEPVPDPPPDLAPTAPLPEPAPRHRLVYSNTLVVRVNPLGLEDRFSLMYRRRLSARTGKLWDDTYFGIGITPTFAPSITRLGPTVMLVPLAVLQLRASYYFVGNYGSQTFKPHAFDSPNDQYGPDTIKARADNNLGINTYGGQAELSALFQVKFGPIAVINEAIFFRNMMKLPAPNDVYYDIRHDILAPKDGWFVSNDTSLVYVNTKLRFNAGLRATYYHIFYPAAAYNPGDVRGDNGNDSARIGPLLSYVFKDRPEKRFTKPTLFFAAQWWVKHRYRTGQEVSQGLPMFILGFSFTGELWSKK